MIQRKTSADWTSEHVRRLWTYWNSKAHLESENFSFQVGAGIVHFLNSTGKLRGKVLDYGCGLGFLVQHLLRWGLECSAAEFSPESVELVNRKFAGHPNWRGATLVSDLPTPFSTGEFDVVTFTETIEHLSDDLLFQVVGEMRRLIKSGGMALFTTPNDENLELAMTYCPFCEAEFHKVQHVRSFTAESLTALLQAQGFDVMFCQNINFHEFQKYPNLSPVGEMSFKLFREWFVGKRDRGLDRYAPRTFPNGRDFKRRAVPGPHLVALATHNGRP